jgi:hypothetical protein
MHVNTCIRVCVCVCECEWVSERECVRVCVSIHLSSCLYNTEERSFISVNFQYCWIPPSRKTQSITLLKKEYIWNELTFDDKMSEQLTQCWVESI